MRVVLPLYAWFYLCRSGFTFLGVVLPLYAWFYLCRRGLAFAGVVLLLWALYIFVVVAKLRYGCFSYRSRHGFTFAGVLFFHRRGYNI